MSLRWRLTLSLLKALPQGLLSRGFGRVADLPVPAFLRGPLFRSFVRITGADPEEAARPIHAYGSLNDFFVRRLREGVRSWPRDPAQPASPVDGIVGASGELDGLTALQAKGRQYSVAELLDDAAEARRFEGGTYVTLYLSPRHYHRIHAPVSGTIPKACHLPGRLLPVNDAAVHGVSELFPRNERLTCYVDSGAGRVAVVAVGAFNVGRISSAFDPSWNRGRGAGASVSNRGVIRRREVRRYDPPLSVDRGGEIMAFHLGSTVVLLFEPGRVELDPGWTVGREVRLGELLGRVRARHTGPARESRSDRR